MKRSLAAFLRDRDPGRHKRGPWPVFPFLLVAAVVPAACVVWFMAEAMRNDRLAARERLRQLAQTQLELIRARVDAFWIQRQALLAQANPNEPPGLRFARVVTGGLADAVVVYDSAGRVVYPDTTLETVNLTDEERTEREKAITAEKEDPLKGAAAWAQMAAVARSNHWVNAEATARRDQARCLIRAGQREAALQALETLVAEARLRDARDDLGNLLTLNVQLLSLRLAIETETGRVPEILANLVARVRDYEGQPIPASQRLFLMQEILAIDRENQSFPTLEAERLAARLAEWPASGRRVDVSSADVPAAGPLLPSPLPGVWQLGSGDGTLAALFSEASVTAATERFIAGEPLPGYLKVRLLAPGNAGLTSSSFLTIRAGQMLPNWQLAMLVTEAQANGFGPRLVVYAWSGLAAVLIVGGIAWASGRAVARQIQLTRLKDDLLATVSHELKTPLSSIRALADTLLAGRYRDPQQLKEYLQLIADENHRLSQLIENFLSFNRLERGKYQFRFEELDAAALARHAHAALRPRLDSAPAQFELDLAANLPPVRGDRDALVTALVNLLDNAWKYTGRDKRIALSVFAQNGRVTFAVRDNGMGVSPAETRSIFDRFYQSERIAPGRPGGCGLGLSIVKRIVEAHGGSVEVQSKVGEGSTFCLHLRKDI